MAVPVVVLLGLAARFGLSGWAADAAGGVLYVALVYLVIAFAWPTAPTVRVGLAGFACSAAVELLQLTSVPADLADAFPPIKLLLGTTFVTTDFLAYAAGALLAATVDAGRLARPHGRR
ncbi:MAG: DUF2809 domain-containing protein [Solirubrobacteraceae bacterium]|nr:DUF2809 domain-containing protein [Solirubrobacteraceae bacterium]